jgi:hypothetical protein
VEEVAAVPELELLDVPLFGSKARLVVDAALDATAATPISDDGGE